MPYIRAIAKRRSLRNSDGPGGIVEFLCLRKRVEAGEAHMFSTADLITHADAKVKFSGSDIDNLYRKRRAGLVSFDQVRKDYEAFRRRETV